MRWSIAIATVLALLLMMIALGCDLGEGSIGVPIELKNADRVGAVAFTLLYDSTVLEVEGVEMRALARGATAGYNADTPGELFVSITNAPNISGNGTLVEVKFKVLDDAGSSTLQIEVLGALNLDTQEPVETVVSDGLFSAADNSTDPPVITFVA